jgi:hypothetical protein
MISLNYRFHLLLWRSVDRGPHRGLAVRRKMMKTMKIAKSHDQPNAYAKMGKFLGLLDPKDLR